MLNGRAAEQAAIDRLLDAARAGTSGALVLRGDAGIGKTALLDYAAAAAAGFQVIRGTGIESEAELPFAGLHLLLRPALDRIGALPVPQRQAVEGAFGLAPAPPGDPLLIGMAVLSLLSELAGDGPLLCLVDDAHWLDGSSAAALAFAARRLGEEGIALIMAARDGEGRFPAPGLPELRVAGLAPESAAALLDVQPADLTAALRYRILAEAQGNPLALIELPPTHLPGPLHAQPAIEDPGELALTGRLLAAFSGQAARLPDATRLLLLVAAADDAGEAGLVLRAGQALGADAADLAPAERAGLIRHTGQSLAFRHPLIRAAVYQEAPPLDLVQVCGAGLIAGQDAQTHEVAAALAAEAREQGRIGLLPTVLFFLAEAELFHGRHRDALATAAEAVQVASDSGQWHWVSQVSGLLAYLAAAAGDEARCRKLADDAMTAATAGNVAPGSAWAHWSLGLLDLGGGRVEAALGRLTTLAEGPARHHVSVMRSAPDLVEAAVRIGEPGQAAGPLQRFERWAGRAGQPWIDALVLRCRALLAPDPEAESLYAAALDAHQRGDRPFERARTHSLYGEWLRRARRKTEARTQLRAALEIFDRLGAEPWSGRAATELRATGVATPEGRGPGTLGQLTPQELQVVRLAARGLSNRDIAAQLFLSPRTVGYHLYKAYPKLGVAARSELPALLYDEA